NRDRRRRAAHVDHAARCALPRRRAVERCALGFAARAGRAVDHVDAGRHRRDAARQAPRFARGMVRRRGVDVRRADQTIADRSSPPARPARTRLRTSGRRAPRRAGLIRAGTTPCGRPGGESINARWCLVACLVLATPAAEAATSDDYAYAWPLQTQGDRAAWQV